MRPHFAENNRPRLQTSIAAGWPVRVLEQSVTTMLRPRRQIPHIAKSATLATGPFDFAHGYIHTPQSGSNYLTGACPPPIQIMAWCSQFCSRGWVPWFFANRCVDHFMGSGAAGYGTVVNERCDMIKALYSSLAVLCVGAALALSMPMPSSGSFAVGGDGCTHDGRQDTNCPTVGNEDCTRTYKTCLTGNSPHSVICTEGGGNDANCKPSSPGPSHDNCGDGVNHASTDSDCAS